MDNIENRKYSELSEAAEEYSGKRSHPLNNAFIDGAKWKENRIIEAIKNNDLEVLPKEIVDLIKQNNENSHENVWHSRNELLSLEDINKEIVCVYNHRIRVTKGEILPDTYKWAYSEDVKGIPVNEMIKIVYNED